MKKIIILPVVFALLLGTAVPAQAATTSLEYSGWIPYWKAKDGARDAQKHLDQLTEINPFVYSVKNDGTIQDLGKMKSSTWKKLLKAAYKDDVRVVPTIMWSDTASIDRILRDPKLRAAHIKEIVAVVEKNKYDGIDIDYEGKKAETKEYFSLFLKELDVALGSKWLSCTIEPRTPVADRYTGTPPAAAYQFANDFRSIGAACDTVRLMTYDQQTIDQKLNAANAGKPYVPVADPKWTEKVVALTAKDIQKSKIVIGVATYGREWNVTVSPTGKIAYSAVSSFNPNYADDIEDEYDVERSRNSAGEQIITYLKDDDAVSQTSLIKKAPSGTPTGELVSEGAKAYAKSSNTSVTYRMLWWSDAGAMEQQVALAKRLGVRGVAVFKFDGGEDRGIWDALQ